MIEPGKLNGYLVAIKEELRKAEGKHPGFCEALLDPESRVSQRLEKAERSAREQDNHHYYKIFADGVKTLLEAL